MRRAPEIGIKKLYYSIGEVCEVTGIEPHVLRFWESEFRELSPRKNRGGKRLYREADIALIERIKSLLYDQKFTIAGAKKQLKSGAEERRESVESLPDRELWAAIREGLEEIKRML